MVPESRLLVRRVSLNKTRTGLYETLRLAAADLSLSPSGEVLGEPFGDISLRASALRPFSVDGELALHLASDLSLSLPLAARAHGESRIQTPDPSSAGSFAELLSSFGVPAWADGCELRVEGSEARPLSAAHVDSHGDPGRVHAACVLALGADGDSTVSDVACVVERITRVAGTVRALGGRITVFS
jgi:3-phosphoshikimate 1-carboxyvinyltransferase